MARVHGRALDSPGSVGSLRIAQIAPPWFAVPPPGYGGIELVVSLLTEGLVARGHEVTLFASGDSTTTAELRSPIAGAVGPDALGDTATEAFHAASAFLDTQRYDILHDHSGFVGAALGAVSSGPPVVHMLHGPWTPEARRLYGLVHRRIGLVAISETQRAANRDVEYLGTVPNGIDLSSYDWRARKEPLLVYIGRATPDKGPGEAIEVARRAGLPLAMIVKRGEPAERAYWNEHVAPLLHDGVEVFEDVPHPVKADLLARAQAMIFPIRWPEPFGLVMAEALASGTPVVACPYGAAIELVEDGVTGFLRDDLQDLVDAVRDAPRCEADQCRRRVENLFSAEAMIDGYERLYCELLRDRGRRSRRVTALAPVGRAPS